MKLCIYSTVQSFVFCCKYTYISFTVERWWRCGDAVLFVRSIWRCSSAAVSLHTRSLAWIRGWPDNMV